ncbi:uncharacterized protein LOC100028763 [Monodelphis domestica]|uniref:uncharacterized protein LOC100028763 n=1 Tax=Monodelphis domestica TaxID=13616 RepID=UPI0024E276EB|nr:uncharacterized protein LOC100028763 [Monodelphis domestica]
MPGLKRYEVALEAEEEIYWGCFYFFPWLRMWRREKSAAPPPGQKLEPLPRLVSCLSRGLGPHPSRRSSPRRPAVPPRGTQQASVYRAGAQPLPSSTVESSSIGCFEGTGMGEMDYQRLPAQPKLPRSSMKGMELILILTLVLFNFSPRKALPPDPSISCCTQVYRKNLPNKLLRNVIRVDLQEANGDCHIKAYVLHRNHHRRPVCVHPNNRSLARWLYRNNMRPKDLGPSPGLNPTP